MYLETEPTEEFVASELERLEYLINRVMSRFDESKIMHLSKKEISSMRSAHETEYGVPTLRKQSKMLRYLLNSD